jgi:hypothetical protein
MRKKDPGTDGGRQVRRILCVMYATNMLDGAKRKARRL